MVFFLRRGRSVSQTVPCLYRHRSTLLTSNLQLVSFWRTLKRYGLSPPAISQLFLFSTLPLVKAFLVVRAIDQPFQICEYGYSAAGSLGNQDCFPPGNPHLQLWPRGAFPSSVFRPIATLVYARSTLVLPKAQKTRLDTNPSHKSNTPSQPKQPSPKLVRATN